MLSVMAASARKRFSATRSTAVKNMLNSSGASTHCCPRPCPTSNLSEHSPSSNRTHACMPSWHWRMTGEHSRWHAKTSKNIPQKGSVDGVICFGEVDIAQVQGGVLLPCQFLQSSYYEHHVNRRALGSEPTLFLRQNVLAFAIINQATHDDFEEYFAGVSHEGDATIIATLSPIFLLVSTLIVESSHCCGTPPSLDTATMISCNFPRVFNSPSSAKTFKSSAGRPSGPTAFQFANARIASSTSYLDGTSSSGLHGGHCLSSSTMLGSRVGDLVLSSL